MKEVILLILSVVMFAHPVLSNTQKGKAGGAAIRLDPAEVMLGEIPLDKLSDEHGKVSIKVVNEGTSPLILNKVEGCCGTEVQEYTKSPILPGKEGVIKVRFRIEPKTQSISRTVTVHSNAVNAKELKCPIVGSVVLPKRPGRIEF